MSLDKVTGDTRDIHLHRIKYMPEVRPPFSEIQYKADVAIKVSFERNTHGITRY